MTYLHFAICATLTYLPPWVVYKSTRLAEFHAWDTLFYGAFGYLFTQFVKVIYFQISFLTN